MSLLHKRHYQPYCNLPWTACSHQPPEACRTWSSRQVDGSRGNLTLLTNWTTWKTYQFKHKTWRTSIVRLIVTILVTGETGWVQLDCVLCDFVGLQFVSFSGFNISYMLYHFLSGAVQKRRQLYPEGRALYSSLCLQKESAMTAGCHKSSKSGTLEVSNLQMTRLQFFHSTDLSCTCAWLYLRQFLATH